MPFDYFIFNRMEKCYEKKKRKKRNVDLSNRNLEFKSINSFLEIFTKLSRIAFQIIFRENCLSKNERSF